MAIKFNRSQTFATNGTVTAAGLHNLVDGLDIYQALITDQTNLTSVGTADELLIADADLTPNDAPRAVTVQELFDDALTGGTFTNAQLTGSLTYGTATGNRTVSTSATITTGTIPNLTAGTTTSTAATITTGTIPTGTFGTTTSTAATITTGTIPTLTAGTTTSTAATITTGTIPTLVATTLITSGTGTAAAPAIVPTGDTNTGIFFPAADTAAIATQGTEAVRIDSSGNVGIGTTSPLALLDVVSPTGADLRTRIRNALGNAAIMLFQNSDTGTTTTDGLLIGIDSAENAYLFNYENTPIRFGTDGAERLRITGGGEVYIAGATDQGAYNLQVNGTGVWGAGAYVNGSDERLKENIQDITSGLDVVEKLRPVSFQYKEEYTADRSVQSGFIAQDLLVALEGKNYLEGVVSKGPTYYNVAYQNLIPILAKAIQDLNSINNSQAQTITALESRIAALEAA